MIDATHVVFDTSAVLALGASNRITSRLVTRAAAGPSWVYVPTAVLIEAEVARRGVGEHIAGLDGIEILPVDLPAALWIARHHTEDWGFAHAIYSAMPNVDRPLGAVIATADPKRWAAEPLVVIDVAPEA